MKAGPAQSRRHKETTTNKTRGSPPETDANHVGAAVMVSRHDCWALNGPIKPLELKT